MPSAAVTVIVCAPVFIAWLAVCGPACLSRYLSRRRQRRQRAQWARLAAGLSGLDADLDRTWTAEHERIRRHP